MTLEAIELLQELGLTEYEAKCIASLFRLKEAKATEISMESQVPKTRIYDILENLEKKELVIAVHNKPKKYAVIDAVSVMQSLLEEKKAELQRLEEKSASVGEKIRQTKGVLTEEEKVIKVKRASDFGNILIEEVKNAKKSVEGFSNMALENSLLLKALNEKHKNNVKVSIIHSQDKEQEANQLINLKRKNHDTEALIIDNKKLFLGIGGGNGRKSEHHFALIKNEQVINALKNQFDLHWNKE